MTNCTNAKDVYDLVTDIQLLDWPGIVYLLDLILQDIPESNDAEHLIKIQDGLWLLLNCVKSQAEKQNELLNKLYSKLPDYHKN